MRLKQRGWLVPCLTAALSAVGPARPVSGQLSNLDRQRVQSMLDHARDAITANYYDSTYHGVSLAAVYDTAAARIRAATDIDRAIAAVAQFALDFHDSHTFFVPPQMTVWAEYGWDLAFVGDTCFVITVDKESDAEKQGVRPGDAVLNLNGYQPTRANLWQLLYLFRLLRPQRALRTVLLPPGGQPRTVDLAAKIHERKRILDLTGSDGGEDIAHLIRDAEKGERESRAQLLEVGDSILVWRFPTFATDQGDVEDIMDRARRKRTLILDLRGNSGGPINVLRALVDRFSRDSLTIAIEHERRGLSPLSVKGAGDRAFTGQLLVLVDSRSASASEITARVTQLAKRGRVLGDRTAGAVMRARYHSYSSGTQTAIFYGINVTDADLVMADGGRLESVGVVPDELILPTPQEMASGADPVLARALALAGQPMSAADAGSLLRRKE